MRTLCDRTEIVTTREIGGRDYEVCARSIATLNDSTSELTISLDSVVRAVNRRGSDHELHPPWLPHADTVRDTVPLGEACDETRMVVEEWGRKVRASIPDAATFARSVAE